MFLKAWQESAVIRRDEMVEHPLRNHWAVIVAHVLRNGHKGRHTDPKHLVEQLQVELQQVGVDGMQQLRVIVEGEHEFLKAHERSWEPEKALHGGPYHSVSLLLL